MLIKIYISQQKQKVHKHSLVLKVLSANGFAADYGV